MHWELWLYGSRARGDADHFSDTDVLVIADDAAQPDEIASILDYVNINISQYSWKEIEAMAAYGSLFLHHIAAEGARLHASTSEPGRFPEILGSLPRFSRAREDLIGFRRALEESRGSLRDGGWLDFECEVVATVARHAAILGAHCLGQVAFGREYPFIVVGAALGYSDEHVEALVGPASAWRLRQEGPHREPAAAESWLALVERFLDDLGPVIDDYAAVLPKAA